MISPETRGKWLEILGMAILSTVLFHISVLFVFFLIPLEVIRIRKGTKAFFTSACLFLAGTGIIRIIQIIRMHASEFSALYLADFAAIIVFVAGLWLVSDASPIKLRRLYRFFIVTGVFGIVSIPLILIAAGNEEFMKALKAQAEQALSLFSMMPGGADSVERSMFDAVMDTDRLIGLAKDVFFSMYLCGLFLFLAGTHLLAGGIAHRTLGTQERFVAARFKVPEPLVWPLIAALAGVLAAWFFKIGPFSYVFTNTAGILVIVYGIQGLGIIQFLLERYNVPRMFRILIVFGILIVGFIPKANWVVFIGIPGFGVSETWIKYRRSIERS